MDRVDFIKVLIFGAAIAILGRLFYWQFIAPVKGSFEPNVFDDTLPAERGGIYAVDGFPLVTNQESLLVYGKPQEVSQSEKAAQILAPYVISGKYATREAELSNDEKIQKNQETSAKTDELVRRLENKNLFWVQLARKVPPEVRDKIKASGIAGIGFEKDSRRFYPEASMAARLLGFVASDKSGTDTGYFGLEGYYDQILRGKSGRAGSDIDPLGLPILVGKYRRVEPQKGTSLYLSIDRAVQFLVEEKLREAVERYGAKEGMVIVASPDGKIIAMATYPTYYPALFTAYDENLYKNPVVADTYEPGSTFKLITMSAALDLSLVDPSTRCDVCAGPRLIGGYEISTWNKKYYPDSTMAEVIEHSDNVGMTFVADKLRTDKFFDYIGKFGFGKKTGIDLEEESSGFVRAKKDWKAIDLATASFGQGIAVTPIQMIQAVCAIANEGKLVSPRLVEKMDDNGNITEVKPTTVRQVISPKTAVQITEMMVNAVEKGEARAFAPKGLRIAGKTGTAQIPVAGHYDPNKTIASFVGFAPAEKPKFVMLVKFTEPVSSPFGAETAAPVFFEIAKEIFNRWGILPSK